MSTFVDVIYKDTLWHVVIHDGSETRDLVRVTRKSHARLLGIGAAMHAQCEVMIRDRKGRIKEKNSYGNDPKNIPG